MILFYTYNYCTHFYPCRCSRRQDMAFLPEMVAPMLVLVVAPTQRPTPPKLGLDMETNLLASAARSRADRTRRIPPAHELI